MQKKSFAKINLYLEILNRDSSGYHYIQSLMAFLDIFDLIKISEDSKLNLEISGANSSLLSQNWQENIIIKSVNLLAKEYSISPKIKISLEKNIPVGAGLGGGSSNAATILLMLNEFYNLNLSLLTLKEIGFEIGADVPFCLHQKAAFVSGFGEKISDFKLMAQPLLALIINPNKPLSTKTVFELFDKENSVFSNREKTENNVVTLIKSSKNDLENSAIKLMPEIQKIINEIGNQKNCLVARMSGSGATCFGLFDNQNDLNLAEQNLKKLFPNFYIKKSQVIYDLNHG